MTWYLAICTQCTPLLPQPFTRPEDRDRWVTGHKQGTGHQVLAARQDDEEITAAPGQLYARSPGGGWAYIGGTGPARIRLAGGTIEVCLKNGSGLSRRLPRR